MLKYRNLFRYFWLISFLAMGVFLLSCPTYAILDDTFSAEKPAKASEAKPQQFGLEDIGIPEDLGLIKNSFKGNSDKIIIHIQDAHCNYEAQSNISKILDMLMDRKGLILVAVEGSAGKIDTSLFNTFPDEDIKKEVATYFMKKGKISGAELLAITTKKPITLYGVENKDYYLENLKCFTTTLPVRGSAKQVCGEIKSYLNRLKGYIYNNDLKELDKKISDYEEDKIKFVDFCVYLNKVAQGKKVDLARYNNFSHFTSVLDIEKGIDFDKVDGERTNLINALEKKLSQDQLSDLFLKSLSYKTKKISASEYYTYLRDLAVKAKIKVSDYKNLNSYIDYLVSYAKVDNGDLFKEIATLEDDIRSKLYTNDDQRTLTDLTKNIKLMNGLMDISLSTEDAQYFMKNKDQFQSVAFINFIEQQASRYALAYSPNPNVKAIDELLPTLENFYIMAKKREVALINNTLNKMDQDGVKISALITGGYHTEGIMKLLKDKGISYVVISPRITKLDTESPYLKILSGEEVPFEEILSEGEKQ